MTSVSSRYGFFVVFLNKVLFVNRKKSLYFW